MFFERMGQIMDMHLLEFDMRRRQAEARRLMRGGCPDETVSDVRMQNASLFKNEAASALASLRNAPAFSEVSVQMRRLLGPRRCASREDVLAAAAMDTVFEEEDFDAWGACR